MCCATILLNQMEQASKFHLNCPRFLAETSRARTPLLNFGRILKSERTLRGIRKESDPRTAIAGTGPAFSTK